MPNINFYEGDCMKFMASKPDGFYSLAVVDPPYGIGEDGGDKKRGIYGFGGKSKSRALAKARLYSKKQWDGNIISQEYFLELKRVSKNQIMWGANHYISKILLDSSCWIVWDKMNAGNDFADCELAWTSFKSAVRKFEYRWNGMLQGDMKNKENRIHPTQKPVALYKWLLQKYAKPGDNILDTHGGSFSSAIACYDLGLDLDICELDKEYFEAGKARFDKHVNRWHEGMNVAIKDENDYSKIGGLFQ